MQTILGLTCISEELKEKDKAKYSFRTMTRKRFNDLCNSEGRDEAIFQLSEEFCTMLVLLLLFCIIASSQILVTIGLVAIYVPWLLMKHWKSILKSFDIEAIKQISTYGILAKTLNISMGSHPINFAY